MEASNNIDPNRVKEIEKTVKALKKEHGIKEVFVLTHEDKVAYLKKPSRAQIKYGMSVNQGDPLGMTEHILTSGWLAGDEEFKTDDDYFYGVSEIVDSIVESKQVELAKY